jgi:anthranilate phosphoribosyltransferase
MLREYIEQLMHRQHLDRHTTETAINTLLSEDANPAQVAAFLVLMRSKPETLEEMVGIANALRSNMVRVPYSGKLLDIVGTGGDNSKTVNISTGAAIIAATCGAKVAKHGNRAVSSLCGSADVLQKFGVNIELSADKVLNCINEVGIGFCFSPLFHPAMQHLRGVRKQLNIPTTFNLLGPLLNPANASHYLLGVYDRDLMELLAELLFQLGTERSLVVHGKGLDEISCLGVAEAIEVTPQGKNYLTIDPTKYGLASCELYELQGGDVELNAHILYEVLSGRTQGAIANTLLLNAAIGLWLFGLYDSIEEAMQVAQEKLLAGEALELLKRWITVSQKV